MRNNQNIYIILIINEMIEYIICTQKVFASSQEI